MELAWLPLVQVGGKVRATIELKLDADEATAMEVAMADKNVQKWTEGKEVKKVIYRQGKILNIVVGK